MNSSSKYTVLAIPAWVWDQIRDLIAAVDSRVNPGQTTYQDLYVSDHGGVPMIRFPRSEVGMLRDDGPPCPSASLFVECEVCTDGKIDTRQERIDCPACQLRRVSHVGITMAQLDRMHAGGEFLASLDRVPMEESAAGEKVAASLKERLPIICPTCGTGPDGHWMLRFNVSTGQRYCDHCNFVTS